MLGDAPFQCATGACPAGYECVEGLCIRNGAKAPVLVTTLLANTENAFSLATTGDSVQICWVQGTTTEAPGIYRVAFTPGRSTPSGGVLARSTTAAYDSIDRSAAIVGVCFAEAGNLHISFSRPRGVGVVTSLETGVVRADAPTVNIFRGSTMSPVARLYSNIARVGNVWWLPLLAPDTTGRRVGVHLYPMPVSELSTEGHVFRTCPLAVPAFSREELVWNSELHAGGAGAWEAVGSVFGRLYLAWLDAACPTATTAWIDWPPADRPYSIGHVLAVRGNEAAVAYRGILPRSDGRWPWQVYWISPESVDEAACAAAQAAPEQDRCAANSSSSSARPGLQMTVHLGPELFMDAGVLRPAGLEDNGRLIIAGAESGRDLTLWSAPWGTVGADPLPNAIPKLSALAPARIALTRVGDNLVAVWSEQIPEMMERGTVTHLSLNAASIPFAR